MQDSALMFLLVLPLMFRVAVIVVKEPYVFAKEP